MDAPFRPHGAIPALVTPLDQNGELLEDGLRAVVDHVINGGVHGVFVLGSSGEIYGLDARQKRRVVEIAVEHVGGRVPVYAGASEITTRDCIATAAMAAEVGGVAALSVLTPYFMTPTQAELLDHYRAIAAASELPVLLYTNPAKTQVHLEVDTVAALAQEPGIIGVKDSAGDPALLPAYIEATPDDFAVLCGRDTLIHEALIAGADGAIASTANLVPHVVAGIYDAHVAGDHEAAERLQRALGPVRRMLDAATFPVVLKEGLRLLGVDAGVCFAPARRLPDGLEAELADVLAALTPTTPTQREA